MMISEHNYEAYLLDLFEGRLTKAEHDLLRRFIIDHPELGKWEDLTGDLPVLAPGLAVFPDKQHLHVPEIKAFESINELNYNNWFISFHEGLLNQHEQQILESFLELNPFLNDDFTLLGKLRLVPDEKITFPSKNELKRKTKVIGFYFYRAAGIAATLLFLFTVGWWWLQDLAPVERQVQPLLSMEPIKEYSLPSTDAGAAEALLPATKAVSRSADLPETTKQPNAPQRESLALIPPLKNLKYNTVRATEVNHHLAADRSLENRLLLAAVISESFSNEPQATKSPIARIVQRNLKDVTETIVPTQVLADSDGKPGISKGGFSFWDVAQAGIKTYNTLTDKEIQLVQADDGQGRIRRTLLGADRLNFSSRF